MEVSNAYSITHKVHLHNGVKMPQLGLGVYKVEEGKGRLIP